MPDETTTLDISPAVPNAKEANAIVAATLADQGRESQATRIATESLDTRDALEELRTAAIKKRTEVEEDETAVVAPVVPDATITPAKPDAAPVVAPAKPDAAPVADDIFQGIALPTSSKPKSTEAFAAVKAKALEEISARDAKLAELEKKLAALEESAKNPAPDGRDAELEDHRTFRAKLDVEVDPRFKAFDKEIADNHAFVYSQLLKTGKITQENIDTIKKHGGPGKVHLEKVFELINDPHIQRVVESKIADEEMLHFKKEQAIKATKENVAGYLKEREEAYQKSVKSHNDATQKEFSTLVSKMDWTKDRELPKDADDAVKADVKKHNEFVASTKKDLEAALHDDSPEMRAILLAGMGQLLNLQRVDANKTAKLAAVEKELSEANAKLEKIKSASRSRLPNSAAPVTSKAPEVKKDDFSTPTVDALENIRKQIHAERAAKAAAA